MSSNLEIDNIGNKIWKNKKSELHREDGPAVEFSNGTKMWIINNEFHRTEGPAVIHNNGIVRYMLHDIDYATKELWFASLILEEKYNYIWNM